MIDKTVKTALAVDLPKSKIIPLKRLISLYFLSVLKTMRYNRTDTASILGISIRTVRHWCRLLGVNREEPSIHMKNMTPKQRDEQANRSR